MRRKASAYEYETESIKIRRIGWSLFWFPIGSRKVRHILFGVFFKRLCYQASLPCIPRKQPAFYPIALFYNLKVHIRK